MSKNPINDGSKDPKKVRLLKDHHIKELFEISASCLYQWRQKKLIPYIKVGSTNYYIEDVIIKMLYLRGGKIPDSPDDME